MRVFKARGPVFERLVLASSWEGALVALRGQGLDPRVCDLTTLECLGEAKGVGPEKVQESQGEAQAPEVDLDSEMRGMAEMACEGP